MDVTVLGSGDALGMPVPLCGCEYCEASRPRRRPALLVTEGSTTVVFDAGPDLPAQLRDAGVTDPDAVFLTHHHYDHMGGLWELRHAAMPLEDHVLDPSVYPPDDEPPHTTVPVYLTDRAEQHLTDHNEGLAATLTCRSLDPGTPVSLGSLTVTPFPVDHARPTFDTQGFRIETTDDSVVYAPDLRDWLPDEPAGDSYTDADLLVVEGAGLFRADPHGPGDVLAKALDTADAERTVLVNLNEHLHRQHTDTMAGIADTKGYELGIDGTTYTL